MKRYLSLFLGSFILGLVVLIALFGSTPANASVNLGHKLWSYGDWSNWSACQQQAEDFKVAQVEQSCGTVQGTQTRTRTATCTRFYDVDYANNCSVVGKTKTETQTQGCEINLGECPVPSVTPTPTPLPCTSNCNPSVQGSTTEAPVCSDGSTTQLPANVHVVRSGSSATVNFFITEGDSANIYYKVVGQSDWQFSVADVKPNGDKFVSYTISGLNPKLGYTFGVQQKQGCGGGQIATSVVVDGPVGHLFTFSYWTW